MTSSTLPNSDIWMVRAGEGGRYIDFFLNENVVAVGWGEVGLLQSGESDNDFRQRFAQIYPKDRNGPHQVIRFLKEVQVGDAVATYDTGNRVYHIGVIQSEPEVSCRTVEYGERGEYIRHVNWTYQVSRDALSTDARNRLGGLLTLFRLRATTSQELRLRCYGETSTVISDSELSVATQEPDDEALDIEDLLQEYIAKSDQFVEDQIAKLGWQEMQELVAGILRAMGYRTRVSSAGPDRGVDIVASPDGLGLAEPRIFVEVKHRTGSIGAPAVRSFLGGRRPGDRCLYISTGGFSADARYEADRSTVPLTLLTMPDLRELLVSYYEALDSETRALVPLKKVYWPIA